MAVSSPSRLAPNRSRVSRLLGGAGRGVHPQLLGGHAVEHDVAPPGGHAWHPGQCSGQPPLSRVSRERPPSPARAPTPGRSARSFRAQRRGDGPVGPVDTVLPDHISLVGVVASAGASFRPPWIIRQEPREQPRYPHCVPPPLSRLDSRTAGTPAGP